MATRSLLTFSRSLVADKRQVNLQNLMNETSRLLRHTLPASIELEVTAHPGSPLFCHADPLQLQQLLLNLAINARDAMPDGGSLRMKLDSIDPQTTDSVIGSAAAGKAELYARLTIIHTGSASAPTASTRTEELRPAAEFRPRAGGELTTAHSIITHHGGTMDVHSVPGKSTTITILLPATASDSTDETDLPGEDTIPKGHGELILVAEDDRFVREVITTNLRTNQYEVIDANSGRSMMETCREYRDGLQLLIVDVDLPQRNGLSCLRELRSEGIAVPAVLITGGLDADQGDDLPDRTLVLRKPFQMAHLARLVHSQLCGQREIKEVTS
jgi:CheY-like chemotaxis protein